MHREAERIQWGREMQLSWTWVLKETADTHTGKMKAPGKWKKRKANSDPITINQHRTLITCKAIQRTERWSQDKKGYSSTVVKF